ncbi:globin-like [Ptychodera flava]|uniref:globin-like n=1 Tax=Ptychodera flava TaxID=63121 RepID=UPI003969F772
MGSMWSYFTWSSDGDVPDPNTTLTPNEKKALRDTWSVIYANKRENGAAFFLKLFEVHPDYKKLFKNLEGINDLEELAKHPRLKAHGLRVMASFNSLVENLDDAEVLVQLLVDIGISHAKHKVKEENFNELGGIVLWLIETKSGNSYSEYAKEAWTKAWGVMKPIMVKALNDASEEQKQAQLKTG